MSSGRIDLAVVGAGAAGLFAAIAAARERPGLRVVCFEGARSVGAKILVSGGSRCNVTNTEVTERDFWGGPSRMVKAVLRALPASRTVELFHDMGVALHEECDGKLFPDTNRARTVLDALLRECARLGVEIRTGSRVTGVRFEGGGFVVTAGDVEVEAEAVRDVLFVLDDQDAAHRARRGSSRVKVAPCPSPSLSANTRPPCARAIERTM